MKLKLINKLVVLLKSHKIDNYF